jgi:hypothetical protein
MSLRLILTFGSQLSVAVANPVFTAAVSQVTVILAGQVMIGGFLSSTFMTWRQVFAFPTASLVVHVLLIVNSLGQEPGTFTSVKVVLTTPQLSAVTGEPTAAGNDEVSQLIVTLAGQVMEGFSASFTVMEKLQLPLLPNWSVAVQVMLLVPTGKVLPDGGRQAVVTGQSLTVVGAGKATFAAHKPGSLLTVLDAGQVISGGVDLKLPSLMKTPESNLPSLTS